MNALMTLHATRFAMRFTALIFAVLILLNPGNASAADKPQRPDKRKERRQPGNIGLPQSALSRDDVEMEVTPVDRSSRAEAFNVAVKIDAAIDTHLAQQGKQPNQIISDEVFVRRIYLDLAGRIPTAIEVEDFLKDLNPAKRPELIDRLLESADYVSNFYNFWADVLRLTEKPDNNIVGEPYLAYVKDCIRRNKPYDQWVYEMLTADGKVWDNPAAGYQMRDNGMPLPYVDNTVRIFLGTQIGCAQCHDHPFDQWTQYQFYQLAAFTAGTQTRLASKDYKGKKNPANQIITQAKKQDLQRQELNKLQRLVRANTYAVNETTRRLRLPHDFAYSDGEPNEVVDPAVLWGEVPASAADLSLRHQFAAWLTSAENRAFSRTVANRLWHRLTGVGVVEPIDDFRDENSPFSQELLHALSVAVVDLDFDLRELVRSICYSQAYQRTAEVFDRSKAEPYVFVGPTVRRMTAEQVWDSILTMTTYNPWPFQRPTGDGIAEAMDLDLASATYEDALERAKSIQPGSSGLNEMRDLTRKHGYRGLVLAKASELPTPLPAGHFLRQFGQSDRETINGNTEDATVPQILTMFNGPITHSMLESGSRVYDAVDQASSTSEAIDKIFLSVLSRYPDDVDRRVAMEEMKQASSRTTASGNLIWALLNTREFIFVH